MPLTDVATVVVEASWATNPDDAPTWVNIPFVESVAIANRGRSTELDLVNPARSVIPVDNTDGAYSAGKAISGGTVTTDRRIRVRATIGGTSYGLADHVIESCPTSVSGFDYANTVFTGIDYFDALAARTLQSAYIENTLAESPDYYFTFGESAGATSVGDLVTGMTAPVVSGLDVGNTVAGAAAFGGSPFWPTTDPTTNLSLAPHITSGTPDGGRYVQLGYGGSGAYLTGTTWALRLTFATTYADSSGYLFYQTNTDTSGVEHPVSIYLSSGGFLSVNFPGGGGFAPAPAYNDGVSHTLQLYGTPSATYFYIDGALYGTDVAATSACTATGNATVGGHLFGSGRFGFPYHGQIGHIAMWTTTAAGFAKTRHALAAAGWPGEMTGTRITRILGWIGFTGTNGCDTGLTPLAALNCSGNAALAECQAAAVAEDGIFFMDGSGNAVFRSRAARYATSRVVTLNTTASLVSAASPPSFAGATFGGFLAGAATVVGQNLPVDTSPLTFDFDRQHMVNDMLATRPSGPTFRVKGAASIAAHRDRTPSGGTLTFNVSTDAELWQAANWYLYRYGWPRARVGSIQVRPFTVPSLAVYAATLQPFDRIGIDNLPANAPATSMDFLVESIGHPKLANDDWVCDLTLSPFVQVLIPGDLTFGLPGTAVPAY